MAMPTSRRDLLLSLGALALARGAAAQPRIFAIHLVPLGAVEGEYLEICAEALRARLTVEVKFGEALPLPDDAYYPPRKRYRAEKLLDYLDEKGPADAWKIFSVTHAEISTTKGKIFDWGIAGIGSLAGRPCVVSTFLYKKHSKTRAALERRLADVTVHEFGHTLGMPHCETKGCVMSDARGKAISSADQSTGQYCPKCRGLAQWGALILKPSPPGGGDGGQAAGTPGPRVGKDGGQ